jgi:hypothetical protein
VLAVLCNLVKPLAEIPHNQFGEIPQFGRLKLDAERNSVPFL